jgi:hypothetical protein
MAAPPNAGVLMQAAKIALEQDRPI